MSADIDAKKLQKALLSYIDTDGATWTELERSAGVYNLGKISRGESIPTITTWWKIHNAAPDIIPAPSLLVEDGQGRNIAVTRQSGSGNIQAGRNVSGVQACCDMDKFKNMNPDLPELVELIWELRSPYQIKQMIADLKAEKGA